MFITRLAAIEQHVAKEYPQIWIDTYLFLIAILLVAVAAAISIVARAANAGLWYPLIILLVPAMIAFFTTRRRNTYYIRLARVSLLKTYSMGTYCYSIMTLYKVF